MTSHTIIYIPAQGTPRLLNIQKNCFNAANLLKCTFESSLNIDYMTDLKYDLTLHVDSFSKCKQLKTNKIASSILKREKVKGDCLLMDQTKSLTLEDLKTMLEHSEKIVYSEWVDKMEEVAQKEINKVVRGIRKLSSVTPTPHIVPV